MKIAGLFISLLVCCFFGEAQTKNAGITGLVYDSVYNKALAYTTVSVIHVKDSTLVGFTRADSSGKFQLTNITPGEYLLSFSYVGYLPGWKQVYLKSGQLLDLSKIALTNLSDIGNVTVVARRPPVTINNDTIEFNTENFKTQPNAVVEDLLKKLPGVTVEKDGTIKVNGQQVNRFLVNGKEFFTGDPKLATRNLDADAVDKVQVFEKKSDRTTFTGIDDGQSEKAINLKLKKDRDNAVFGKITAAAGTKERYDAQTNVNRFKGEKQVSLIGMGNNTNRQGFSIADAMNFSGDLARGMRNGGGVNIRINGGEDNGGLPVSGMGQNQQGIATTFAGGLNYNNSWKNKTDLNLSGIASDVNLQTDQDIFRQNLLPGNNFNYQSSSNNVRHNQQQRFNMALDQKLDTFTSIKFTPQITLQKNENNTSGKYTSLNSNGAKMNEGSSNSTSVSEAFNLNSSLLLRHRFKKKGRTISSTLSWAYNSSKQDGTLNTSNRFFVSGQALPDSVVKQINQRNAITQSIGANLVYTEPVGKRSLLEFNGFYNTNNGESSRNTYDYNSTTLKYDLKNSILTNEFENTYTYRGGGMSFRSNLKKITLTTGANLQLSQLESMNKTTHTTIRKPFTDLLPLVNMQYKPKSSSTIGFTYNASTTQPSTFQLQPVADISDPLNTYQGNPSLNRSYTHTLTLNMSSFDMYTQRNVFTYLSYSQTNDAIINADIIRANGSRYSTPVNADGNYFLVGSISKGIPVKKLKSRIDIGLRASALRNKSLINSLVNKIDNYSINPSITYQFTLDTIIDISLSARLGFNNANYSLQPILNNHYQQHSYGIQINNYLPGGWVFSNELDITANRGRNDGYNTTVPLWYMALAKSFLNYQRGELKFSVSDLLNKNIGINRTVNQNFTQDTRYNVLQRYFQLSFSYRLNRSGSALGGAKVVIRAL